MNKKFTVSHISALLFRSAVLISAMLICATGLQAQTANKRLYMKSGSALSRVVPTAGTATNSATLTKTTASVTSSGSFNTNNGGLTTGSMLSTVSGSSGSTTANTYTPSGVNRAILVTVSSLVGANNAISGVKFGATSLTKLSQAVNGTSKVEIWYLLSPTTTAQSVEVLWPAGQNLECMVGVTCLQDVDQTVPFGTVASATGSTTSSSLTVSSAPGDIVLDVIALNDGSITEAVGQTRVFGAKTNSIGGYSSYKSASAAPATTTNMSWSALGNPWATLGVAIKGFSNDAIFTQASPGLCGDLTIKAGSTITVFTHASVTAGTISGSSIPYGVSLTYGSTTVFESFTATNSGLGASGTSGTLTWAGTIASDITVPAGQQLSLAFFSGYAGTSTTLQFDAASKISYIELPVSTYINVNSLAVYDAAYSGGSVITNSSIGATNYIRAVVSDPFGFDDITGLDVSINSGTAVAATSVATSGCTRTYEYAWTPSSSGSYTISVTAKEGTENTVTHSSNTSFTVNAPSVAVTKTVTSPSGYVTVGDNVTFNIAINNNGQVALSTIPLKDEFSSSCFQFVSASVNPVSYANGVIGWNNVLTSSLAAGATRNITVVMKVIGNCSPLTNTAKVEGAKDALNNAAPNVSSAVNVNTSQSPVAVADSYCIGSSTALSVLTNDTDPDIAGFLSASSAGYTVSIVSSPASGSATVNGDKTIQFNPSGMSENQVVTFTYKVTETASGFESAPATVTVTYSTANDAPVATADVTSTPVDAPVVINVLANDTDADGTITSAPTVTVAPGSGTVVVNADGTITYTPFSGFAGTDVFTYQITGVGCPTPNTTATATVTVNVIATIKACKSSTNTVISVPAIGDAISYTWTLPTGVVVNTSHTGTYVTTTNSISLDLTGVAPGIYDICAKATNSCGTGPDQCTKLQVLQVSLTNTVTNVGCFGSKTGSIDLTPSGGQLPYTYSWTGPNGYTASIEDISGLAAGSYTVTVTEANGCTATATITVSAPASTISATASITAENTYGSANGAIDVTVTGGTSPYTYSWSNGATTEDLTGLTGGTYKVTITDANGCTAVKYFTVNWVGGPLAISGLVKTDLLCAGGSTGTVDLEIIGGTTPYTYSWTGPSSFTSSAQDLSALAAGTYSVTITDAATPANSVSTSVEITGPAAALDASATTVNPTCAGASTGSVDVSVTGGTSPYTYLWNTGATTQDLTNVPAGSYDVTVTDANGCTTTVSKTLTAPTALALTGSSTNVNCSANDGAIDLSVSGGTPTYTYSWSNGATTQDLTGLAPGTYTVIVTDAAGCTQGKSFTINSSCLGLAKTISSSPVNNGDGTYTLTYTIKVQNVGTTLLSNVQVTDDMSATFVGSTSFTVNSVVCNDFTTNPSYNGTSNTNLLAAPLGSLVPNQITNIQITVTVTPGTKLGVYNNSASGSSTDPNGTSVTDVSQNGSDVDPDSDGPGDNSDPTPVSFTENPKIGIAKAVTAGPTNNGNGTYDLTYTFKVTNDGDVPLKQVQVTDNLISTYGSVPLTVLSITSPTLTVNSSYDGTSDTSMLAGTDVLAVRGIATIEVSIRVSPSGTGPFNNTAIASGNSPGNTPVTDSSENGALTDPNGDLDPTDNNIPTPVSFTESPSIGLAKELADTPINNNDGTYTLTYSFILRNTGDVPVRNLQVFDTLSVTFPGKTVVVDNITTTGGLTASGTYTGTGSNTGLLSGSDTLAVGASGTISLTITVTPGTNLGIYNNSATASGTGPLGTPVTDVSHDGKDIDPENDGSSDNSTPTPVSFTEEPQVGIAKSVNTPTSNGDGTFNATYTIKVTNTGDVPFLTNMQVTDTLSSTFSGAVSFEVISVTTTGTLTANSGYNGSTDVNLLVAASSTLASGDTDSITVVVKIRPGSNLGPYNNNAIVSATSPGGTVVTDISTDGSEVDPDDNGDPSDNSVPTPLTFEEDPRIGVAKRVSVGPTSNGNGTYNLSYDIRVQNLGNVALSDVQVIEDLTITYANAVSFTYLSSSITTQPASTTLALNGSFNGSTNVDLLTGTGTLQPGEYAIIRVNITVNPGVFDGPYENTATAYGTSPAGTTVVDDSEDGANVDPNSDGDANDNDTPTPVSFTLVSISGNVFNDVDGLTDNLVDGTGTNAGGLYVNLVNPTTGAVIASIPVNSDGTYTFTPSDGVQANTSYNIILSSTLQTVGANLTTASLPAGWTTTGENLGTGTGSDATANSILSVTTGTSDVTDANFGIEQLPTAGSGTYATLNPGGDVKVVVPASTFTNTTPSSDIAPGTVTSIRITAFPTNATSITINGVTYTSATFPAGGVIVPTDADGNPTQVISVDPNGAGNVIVTIPFKAIDNAGKESTNTGTAVIEFSPVVITGTVFNDTNALTDGTVNGTGTDAGGLYANLVNPTTGAVIASVPVNQDGTYAFTSADGVLPNTNYNIILTAASQTVGATLTAATLPSGWTSTGENQGAGAGSDGTANSILSVNSGTTGVSNANFGIQSISISGTIFNDPDGLTDGTVDGTGTDADGLYVNLVNPTTGAVIASVPVNADGTYTFTGEDGVEANTSYSIILTTSAQTVGATLSSATLPTGWSSTGEYLGTGAGSDGTVNSILSVTTGTTNVTNANLAIQQPPVAGGGYNTDTNPGGTTQVTVPTNTFTNIQNSSDTAPGTVTSIRITAFPTNATSIVIDGVSYTSATFPAGGVIVPTDANGNPTQTITVDPAGDGSVRVTIPFVAIDNAGQESTNTGTAVLDFDAIAITGTVFNDPDALTNSNVDGIGTNAGGLYANLVNPETNEVIASVAVAANGTYIFTTADGVEPLTTYNIILTATAQTVGDTLTTASLPAGWLSTGEDCCDNAGSDGTVNSILTVSTTESGVSQANFGIQQPPTAGSGIYETFNPGGTTQVTVPPSTFTNITNSSDESTGTVTAIRITAFPSNATSIVINGVSYTSATFPAGGVTVPTDADGNPTQTITVDPIDGNVTVTIPFRSIDNAGAESTNIGTAVIKLTELTISGTVFNDANELTDGAVNGSGTNTGGLYANLVDPVTNQVIASVPVASNGSYLFGSADGVRANTNYNIILTATSQTAGTTLTSATLPTGWTSTGESCCTTSGSDGTVNSVLGVSTGTTGVVLANFGIKPILLPLSWLSFTAALQPDRTVKLDWRTADEINTQDFLVERTTDGANWVVLGQVAAMNQVGTHSYNFIDVSPKEGVNYYRIRQRDLDGQFELSVIRSVKLDLSISVRVSPNPTPGLIQVQIQGKRDRVFSIEVLTVDGIRIYQGLATGAIHSIDLSRQAAGTYWLRVLDTQTGEPRSFKIVRQ